MTPAEELYLKTKYEQDPSFAYECGPNDLQNLLNIFGEMEPIIDAINVNNGASVEQRAQDIGCHPSDFREWDDNETIAVKDLELAANTPWNYGV